MNIAAFTGSHTISSRRFRVLQYLDFLKKRGIDVDEFIANYGSWPPTEGWKRPIWFILTFLDRIQPVIRSRKYDLTLLQRELISTLFTLERFAGRPLIIDVDDAVWLTSDRSRKNFLKLIRFADGIICGNSYIYESLADFNSNRVILPTAVDTRRFNVKRNNNNNKRKIIGWSGLAAGSKYLLSVEKPLMQILENDSNAILRVVSDSIPNFRLLKPHMLEYIKWTPENEVSTIQEMDIGLMPLQISYIVAITNEHRKPHVSP